MSINQQIIGITTANLVDSIKRQALSIGCVGDIDLFGTIVTGEDIVRSMRELGRVASMYAEHIANTGKQTTLKGI